MLVDQSYGAQDIKTPPMQKPTSDQLINDVQHRAFLFFWNESSPVTGLTKDRAGNFAPDSYKIASIASTGYALSALPIGVERKWVSHDDAYQRALLTLRFLNDKMPEVHGWYYHFVDVDTGAREWSSELSTIDTALLLCGVLTVGQYFHGTEVERLASAIYARTDFRWMQTEGGANPDRIFLTMGWSPEKGFYTGTWHDLSECTLLYFLAMGSPTHPITNEAWNELDFNPSNVEGYDVLRGPEPLFITQMPAGYFDVRNQRDSHGYDFWVNTINSHLANHAFCVENIATYKSLSDTIWGFTASDEPPPAGYGAESDSAGQFDGTVAPSASITSILVIPDIGKRSLVALYDEYKDKIWGRYGFSNAFNVDKNWYDKDVIGIDLGMTLLALENYRTCLIWRLTDKIEAVKTGMALAGFHKTKENPPRHLHRD